MTNNRFNFVVSALCLALIATTGYILATGEKVFGKPSLPMPPYISNLKTYGCTATQATTTGENTKWWQTRVYVDYVIGGRWVQLFTVREGAEHSKAMKDCSEWLKAVEKEFKKRKPKVSFEHYQADDEEYYTDPDRSKM